MMSFALSAVLLATLTLTTSASNCSFAYDGVYSEKRDDGNSYFSPLNTCSIEENIDTMEYEAWLYTCKDDLLYLYKYHHFGIL